MAAAKMSVWAAFVERMLPANLKSEQVARSRFFVRAWAVVLVFAAVTGVISVLGAIWSQVAITGVMMVCAFALLALHRRGFPFNPLAHASLVVGSLVFGLGALAQRPGDYTSLTELLLIPLLAGLLLGHRGSRPWLFITTVWAAAVAVALDLDWTLPFVDPTPSISHVVNLSVTLTLAWLFSGSFDDVREQAVEHLRGLDRARRAFLANISHEIRTPMNGVLGMTEVMLLGTLSGEQREQLRIIQRSGRTLVSLINDLLDVSKMEAGKLALEDTDFNLDTVLADVQGLGAASAASKGLRLVVSKGVGVPARLRGDGLRLGQVLTNLVSNAVKFTSVGEVRLEVTRLPGDPRETAEFRFAVTDTGVGIPPEVLPRLFNAFQQGDSSTTRRFGGTGLGLALSQQLVNLMGGHIEVTSRTGRGSCFAFSVRLDEAEGPSAERLIEAVLHSEGRKSVLIVDDNAINLKVAVSLVQKAGFHAEGVVNGKEALAAVQRATYALVLMDCHMPEMDGFEATERIRGLPGDVGRTPIVALTASAMPDELAACRRVGMNSVLAKPLTFAALCAVLREQTQGSYGPENAVGLD
jgi:signal transduction histidine kinase/CheY-like chemotaxis protein